MFFILDVTCAPCLDPGYGFPPRRLHDWGVPTQRPAVFIRILILVAWQAVCCFFHCVMAVVSLETDKLPVGRRFKIMQTFCSPCPPGVASVMILAWTNLNSESSKATLFQVSTSSCSPGCAQLCTVVKSVLFSHAGWLTDKCHLPGSCSFQWLVVHSCLFGAQIVQFWVEGAPSADSCVTVTCPVWHLVPALPQPWRQPFLQRPWFLWVGNSIRD